MQKYKNLALILLANVVITSCTLPPKPLDGEGSSQSVNTHLVCAKQINIQPISINGAMPPKASFDYSMQKLKKYTTDNIVIHKTINLTLAKGEASPFIRHFAGHAKAYDLSPEEAQAFESRINKLPRSRNSIVMFFTPELHWPTGGEGITRRGYAFPNNNYQPRNVVAYNQTAINSAPFISDTQSWKIVLTHELGHRLGVPAAHFHNKAGHCTRRECVMYPRPDWQAIVSVPVNGMPYDFCKFGQAELLRAKRSCTPI